MLKFKRFAGTVSVVLLALTTACSSSGQPQVTSSAAISPELTSPTRSPRVSSDAKPIGRVNPLPVSAASRQTKPSAPTPAAPKQTRPSTVTPEVALASHLKQIGAKFYGTYWCPYCTKQKDLFGVQAFRQINYIECDEKGKNARPDLCIKANISGFPTWEIKGQLYSGLQSLQELADLSGYQGDRNFKN